MSKFSEIEITAWRSPDYPVDSLFYSRWSPRAMSGEDVTELELMTLFEAARWAPSCYNAQPWRFIYARKNTAHWNTLFQLLVDFNQSWCDKASVLVVVTSAVKFEWGEDNLTHAFDAGAAWQNVALQGAQLGLVVHGMAGFDCEQAALTLKVPGSHKILAMLALGKPAKNSEGLPADLQKEEQPSGRNPVSDFISEGFSLTIKFGFLVTVTQVGATA